MKTLSSGYRDRRALRPRHRPRPRDGAAQQRGRTQRSEPYVDGAKVCPVHREGPPRNHRLDPASSAWPRGQRHWRRERHTGKVVNLLRWGNNYSTHDILCLTRVKLKLS